MMVRLLLCIGLLVASGSARSERYPAPHEGGGTITVYSTTDTQIVMPLIRDFQQVHPGITVDYREIDATPLYLQYLDDLAGKRPGPDLLLSSSMDLQVKLVNDGYASSYASANTAQVPQWARWRSEAFGITYEPAVMVFNTREMAGVSLPKTRAELLELLKRSPGRWKGRVGTYDITRSGVGYLLASQDARQSGEFGGLMETLGDAEAVIDDKTSTLLEKLERGQLAMAYNLLGPYVQARITAGAPLAIVYPADYTLAVSRVAVIPRTAPNPMGARAFLDYLLSLRGQQVLASRCGLPAVREEIIGPGQRHDIAGQKIGIVRPIVLGPGLLTYLDQQKKQRFLRGWRNALSRPARP